MNNHSPYYRAWHNGLKKMLYPPGKFDSMILCRDSEGKGVKIEIEGKEHPFPADMTFDGRIYILGKYQEVEWMQFTGHRDKNGTLIFEGDMYLGNGFIPEGAKRNVFVCMWIKELCMFLWLHSNEYLDYSSNGISAIRDGIEDGIFSYVMSEKLSSVIEIVGNLFENPELLEK